MKNSDNYKKYIEDILHKNQNLFYSGEAVVRKAIASYGIKGEFILLLLYSENCYLYECETNKDGNRFRIKSYDIYNHQLGGIFNEKLEKNKLDKYSLAYFKKGGKYVYDEYYNKISTELAEHNEGLEQVISELPDKWKYTSLIVDGNYSEYPSLIYALQRNATKVISMKLDQASSKDNPSALRCLFPNVMREQIMTNNHITFLDCVKEPKTVFVPLDELSLNSIFYHDIKWRDIIPNWEKDCEIAGVDCKYIMLKVKVDGFQNVFCHTIDAKRNNKYILVYNSQNICIVSENNLIDNLSSTQTKNEKVKIRNTNNLELVSKDELLSEERPGNEINEKIKEIHIKTGETGHSYKSLFGDYLVGATTVVLSEPYLAKYYQWDNLKEFISLLIEAGNVKFFKLKTRRPEIADTRNIKDHEKFISDFYDNLKCIEEGIKNSNIIFSWELSNTHKRWLDTGEYYIDLDYGLDIYSKSEKKNILSSVQKLRKCKENHIKVYKKIGIKL